MNRRLNLNQPFARDSADNALFFANDRSQFLEDLLNVHAYERQRLGQELHDSAGQLLIALHLSVARLRIDQADRAHEELIDDIQDTVRRIDEEIRALAFLHQPAELGGRDLPSALRNLVWGFGRRTGILARFREVGALSELNEEGATALLRIGQEALVNVHRHAHASRVNVILRRIAETIELCISDDGDGIRPRAPRGPQGIGLEGMRHRAEKLSGQFRIRSGRLGTRVVATMPADALRPA